MKRREALIALLMLVPAPSIGVWLAMVYDPTRGAELGKAAYAFSKLWILVLPIVWLRLVDKGRLSLSPPRYGGLWFGAGLGLAIAAAILAAYFLFARDWIDPQQMREVARRNDIGEPAKYLGLAIFLTLVNSLLEEYVWRWFVFRKSEIVLGSAAAVIASALFFTLHHIIALKSQMDWRTTLLASAGIFIGGCAWSWCYRRFRSIWPGYVSHVIVDAAVFAIGWHILFM